MESPIEVVSRFCAAWSNNIGAAELAEFFTDDAVYHNIPIAPITGRDAIAKNIASFIRPGAPGIEAIEFHVINIAANGPVVMPERVDVFKLPEKSFELPVMGTFEVRDSQISGLARLFRHAPVHQPDGIRLDIDRAVQGPIPRARHLWEVAKVGTRTRTHLNGLSTGTLKCAKSRTFLVTTVRL
jgi:limonene-1,2-epoxide hydrolase